MLPKNRLPSHPGEILLHEFLMPLRMTQRELAEKIGVPVQRINTLIKGKRGVTAETALLVAGVLKTSPEFWMNLQSTYDLAVAAKKLKLAA